MPQLKSPRDEIFCQQVALGKTDAEAYRLAGGKGKHSEKRAAEVRIKQGVKERIAELRGLAESRFDLTRDDLLNFFRQVIITPVGQVDETSRLAQEVTTTTGEDGTSRKVKMVGKIDAARELCKILGWYEPEKVEHSGTMVGLLARLTGAKK